MSYLRASTSNPNGWRPGTVRLGEMRRRPAPDWKVAVANHAAAQHAYDQQQKAARGRAMAGMALVDARARGVRLPMFRRGSLSGLGSLDLTSMIVPGAIYVFHFTWGGLGLGVDMNDVAATIAADSNFLNPVASQETNGVRVQFVFGGQVGPNSTVGSYGAEMQNVLNSSASLLTFTSLNFTAAEGGPATPTAPSAGPISPNAPPTPQPPPNSSFSLSAWLASLGSSASGLSIGLGAAGTIALVFAGILVIKEL